MVEGAQDATVHGVARDAAPVVVVRATSHLEGRILAGALDKMLEPVVQVRQEGSFDESESFDLVVDLTHVGRDIVVSISWRDPEAGRLDVSPRDVRLHQLVRLISRSSASAHQASLLRQQLREGSGATTH